MAVVDEVGKLLIEDDVTGLTTILKTVLSDASALKEIIQEHPTLQEFIIDLYNVLDIFPEKDVLDILPKQMVAERLELTGLLASEVVTGAFQKKLARTNTNLFYKQTRFNLLREESEGWAKLLTTVISAFQCNSEPVGLWEDIQSLIGCFALDPGRVLDVILDVAGAYAVVKPHFFIEFLKVSAWWPKGPGVARSSDVFEEIETHGIGILSERCKKKPGNKLAAHILGFKFRGYTSDALESLVILSAFLVKCGFVSIVDLLSHLSPENSENMSECYNKWVKDMEVASEKTNTLSALARAAPLTSEEKPNNSGPEAEGSVSNGKPEFSPLHKLQLLKALLAIGAFDEAVFLLGQANNLSVPFEEVTDLINRIADEAINPIYKSLCTSCSITETRLVYRKKTADITIVEPEYYEQRNAMNAKYQPAPSGIRYEFFYEDWADGIPRCTTVEQLVIFVKQFLLRFNGHRVYRHASLFAKLCRIGRVCVEKNDESTEFWHDLIRTSLLPAISLSTGNASLSAELNKILRLFPYSVRFSLYGEMFQDIYFTSPDLKTKYKQVEKETKGIMKRISKTNINEQGRALARVANANSLVVWTIAINQIESYDNFVTVFTSVVKFIEPLAFDTLSYILLTKLSDERKERLQMNGLNISKWLQSLATLAGELQKQYLFIDPTPFLIYIKCRLLEGKTVDLHVLREIVRKMSGISSLSHLTADQLDGMTGGPLLRRICLSASPNEDRSGSTKRLLLSLSENNLTGVFLIAISQLRQNCVYSVLEDDSQLKLLGNMFDECHTALNEFLELVSDGVHEKRLEFDIPTLSSLCNNYGIDVHIAMILSRHRITLALNELKSAKDPSLGNGESASESNAVESYISEEVRSLLPAIAWKFVHPKFYLTFWQLSLRDLSLPMEKYLAVQKLVTEAVRRSYTDKKQRARLQRLSERLSEEPKEQMIHFTQTRKRLSTEKTIWFHSSEEEENGDSSSRTDIVAFILQYCIYPRALFGAEDAIFCSKFARQMHSMGTPLFSALTFYDKVFSSQIAGVIFVTSELEAMSYGHFLADILGDFQRWHSDESLYMKEAVGTDMIGFRTKWNKPELLNIKEFRTILKKWHNKIKESVALCLQTGEYMHIRNAVIILDKLSTSFPLLDEHADTLIEVLERVRDAEDREDLKLRLSTITSVMSKRKQVCIDVHQFVNEGTKSAVNTGDHTLNPLATEFHHPNVADMQKGAKANHAIEGKKVAHGNSDTSRNGPDGGKSTLAVPNRNKTDRDTVKKDDKRIALTPKHREGTHERAHSSSGRENDDRQRNPRRDPYTSSAPPRNAMAGPAPPRGTPTASKRRKELEPRRGDRSSENPHPHERHSRASTPHRDERSSARQRSRERANGRDDPRRRMDSRASMDLGRSSERSRKHERGEASLRREDSKRRRTEGRR